MPQSMAKNANNLDAFWMPFTANRAFKANPRMLVKAEGMHYTAADGRKIMDTTAGLWCVNAGHGRQKIIEAVQHQVKELDYAPSFQWGHPKAFELAARIVAMTPGDLNHVFFCNSGSEAVDTALKIAIAYHRARGEGTRTRLIGRERGYHGVGFGGISVGGMVANRKWFGMGLQGVDHLPHTHSLKDMAFSRNEPEWGAHLADELERLVALHDASNIAAVIVEPVAGSTGALVPPKGYLKRLREICNKHGILLIFDEVITGFGRLGHAFASEKFDVVPDIMTIAKGVTNATIPMGGAIVRKHIYDAFMQGPENAVELFHGYTYSAHPVAAAAGLATLDVYKEEGLFERAAELTPYLEDAVHSLKGTSKVIDIRNIGMIGAIELEPRTGGAGTRANDIVLKGYEAGFMFRGVGETVTLSPPLIVQKKQIDEMIDTLGQCIKAVA
ncbi:aspartate aminotransferase family protein [Desertibaculum subflavum]|uniref:aspartate aminotransferase family protein n=1 Tax=Desertibaculum subflavum TaxID=2268458 RepID=UPI0034D2DFFA